MRIVRRTPELILLAALGTSFLACEAGNGISAPDSPQPQFSKGGGHGQFTPIPVDIDAAGGFLATGQYGTITDTVSVLTVSAGGLGDFHRTTNFSQTVAAGLQNCVATPSGLSETDKLELLGWLVDSNERIGSFHMTVDLDNPGFPSATNDVSTMSYEPDPVPLQHVGVGNFDLLPALEATVVEVAPGTYEFSGGGVRMWDRSRTVQVGGKGQKAHPTLVCPNLDVVTITITPQ